MKFAELKALLKDYYLKCKSITKHHKRKHIAEGLGIKRRLYEKAHKVGEKIYNKDKNYLDGDYNKKDDEHNNHKK